MEYWNEFSRENGKLNDALDEIEMQAVLKMDTYPATIRISAKTKLEEQIEMMPTDRSNKDRYLLLAYYLNETVMEMGKELVLSDKAFKKIVRLAKTVYLAYTAAYHAENVSK